jgi:hypothetical protein
MKLYRTQSQNAVLRLETSNREARKDHEENYLMTFADFVLLAVRKAQKMYA